MAEFSDRVVQQWCEGKMTAREAMGRLGMKPETGAGVHLTSKVCVEVCDEPRSIPIHCRPAGLYRLFL